MNLPQVRQVMALNRVFEGIASVRNGKAMFTLLAGFATAGLLLAMAESSLVRANSVWGSVQAALAALVAFYGANAAGLLMMDEARGRPPREVADAVRDALRTAHRLLLVIVAVALGAGLLLAVLLGLLWLCRLPGIGPWLFTLAVPSGVVLVGAAAVTGALVVGPLAAPAVWSGLGARAALRFLVRQARRRLLRVALLVAAVSALTAAVGAMVTFAVMAGGRVVSTLAVLVVGVDLPPQQLMAGLFGYGLRSLGAAGAPVAQSPYGAAALVGGGVVFALALVLPGVVYLRGVCTVFLLLSEEDTAR
jgi:hypothetical protein